MNNIIDYIYNFSISLTYHLHECGEIKNMGIFIDGFCNERKIIDIYNKKIIENYSKYYIRNELSWFSSKEEIEEWFDTYNSKDYE